KGRVMLLAELQAKCFRNWPAEGEPADVKLTADVEAEGLRLQSFDYASEDNLRMPVFVVRGAKHAHPSLVVVTAVDTAGWRKWLAEMAPAFAASLPGGTLVEPDREAFRSTARLLDKQDWAFAVIPPRGE